MFPPVHRRFAPEYTDFNYWRPTIDAFEIPDLTPQPASPALSAASDTSGRMSMLGRLAGLGRKSSRQTVGSGGGEDDKRGQGPASPSTRPSSPLSTSIGRDDSDYDDDEDAISDRGDFMNQEQQDHQQQHRAHSMPGSFDDRSSQFMGDDFFDQRGFQRYKEAQNDRPDGGRGQGRDGQDHVDLNSDQEGDDDDDDDDDDYQQGSEDDDVYPEMFDDDLLATGEMSKVPY